MTLPRSLPRGLTRRILLASLLGVCVGGVGMFFAAAQTAATFAVRRGYALSTGNLAVIDDLPYWCAFDLRFPYAAKRLIENPDLLGGGWQAQSEADHFPARDHDAMSKLLSKLQDADIRALAAFG